MNDLARLNAAAVQAALDMLQEQIDEANETILRLARTVATQQNEIDTMRTTVSMNTIMLRGSGPTAGV